MLFSYWDSRRTFARLRRCLSLNQLTGAPLRKQGLKVSLSPLSIFSCQQQLAVCSYVLSFFLSFFLVTVILHMQIRQLNPTPTISISPFSLSVLLLSSLLSSPVPYCLFSSVIQLSLSLHPLFSPSLPLSLHHLPPFFSPSLLCFSSLTHSLSLSLAVVILLIASP